MEQVHPGIGKRRTDPDNDRTAERPINARATEEGAEVGTNLVYAATHQFGASGRVIRAKNKPYLAFEYHGRTIRKKQVTVNIPARPFLGISDEDRQEIKSLVEEALSEA